MVHSKILIVDDHPLVRLGIRLQLSTQAGLHVCGEAESTAEAMLLAAQHQPDLMIVDISLKDGHGMDLVKQVKARHPSVKMLVFSGFEESLYGERYLRAGASGYLNKQESNKELLKAIRMVLDGHRYVSEELARRLISQALGAPVEAKEPIEQLSDRELQVFRMIGQGLASGAIAGRLHLSTHTIDTHRENIKRKIGARDGADLMRMAVQWVLENG